MTPEAELLTVSAAAEVAYCPRSFWYEVHHGRRKARNAAVEAGFLEDQDRLDRDVRRTPAKTRHLAVPVLSRRLGVRGEVDVVEELPDGALVPLEYRHGHSPGTATDRVAMALIAMALEEMNAVDIPVVRLFFMADREPVDRPIDAPLRAEAEATVTEARRILADPNPPPNPLLPRCNGCSWYDVCAPDLTARASGAQVVGTMARSAFERVVYVDTAGTSVKLRGEAIQVVRPKADDTAKEEVLLTVGLETLDQLVLSGRGVHASLPAIRKLSERGIDVTLTSHTGRYEGRFVSEGFRNPMLKRAQHRRSLDPAFRLACARTIVEAKVQNQRVLLQRQKRTQDDAASVTLLEEALAEMRHQAERAPTADSIEVLRGFEGNAARAYFRALDGAVLGGTPFSMARRTRRPPTDPFNALLSFCYALLTKDVEAAILRVGLEPSLGVYHSEVYGRPALALDLMEEMRPVIADAVALRLVNQKILKEADFKETLGAVRLTDAARRRLFEAWESRMTETVAHPTLGTGYSLRRTLEIQARLFAKALEGDLSAYVPFRMR